MTSASLAAAIALAAVLAPGLARAQDAAGGERVFGQCRGCHQVGPTARNGIGPALNGLAGRAAGTIDGFAYSPANKAANLTWDEATFRDYIRDPKARMPGTKMIYAGLKNEAQAGDLFAFLKQYDASGNKATN